MNASTNEYFPNTCIDSGIHLLKNNSHLLLPKLKIRRKKTNISTTQIITEFLATISYLLFSWCVISKSYYIILLDNIYTIEIWWQGEVPLFFKVLKISRTLTLWNELQCSKQILPFFIKWILESVQRHLIIVLLPIVEELHFSNPTPISYFNSLKTIYYCLLLK